MDKSTAILDEESFLAVSAYIDLNPVAAGIADVPEWRSLRADGAVPVPFVAQLPSSWVVLAISDGVWKYVGHDGVREALRHSRGQALLDPLLNRARLPRSDGLQDDFTAVILEAAV
jgi:hypothetical protein